MKKPGFALTFILLGVTNILINNFCNFSQFLMITFLPVMILCIPIKKDIFFAMAVAFITGLAVDFFSDGMLGLTSLALVPVALARTPIMRLVFGEELFKREENISLKRQGIAKVLLAIVMESAVFLLIYIWADAAGTRPFWISLVKFTASLLVNSAISLYAAKLLTMGSDSLWS